MIKVALTLRLLGTRTSRGTRPRSWGCRDRTTAARGHPAAHTWRTNDAWHLIARDELDAGGIIATPSRSHSIAEVAIGSGEHVLVERPGRSEAEAKAEALGAEGRAVRLYCAISNINAPQQDRRKVCSLMTQEFASAIAEARQALTSAAVSAPPVSLFEVAERSRRSPAAGVRI
jgi:hypothetical protein